MNIIDDDTKEGLRLEIEKLQETLRVLNEIAAEPKYDFMQEIINAAKENK